ncbi:MAG: restriction endonuclease [Pirellulales bacterium]
MSTPSNFDPATLNREIAQLETEAARLEIERASAAAKAAHLRRRNRYLQLARRFRAPSQSVAHFPLLALATGPLICGVFAFVVLNLLSASWLVAFVGFLVAAASCAITLAALLYHPSQTLLPSMLTEVVAKLAAAEAQMAEKSSAATELRRRLAALHEQRNEWGKSEKLQRAMLLQRNWKSMRGGEWEDFVVEICRTLGANVQRGEKPAGQPPSEEVPAKGARGVIRRMPTTLYITFSPKRFAVAAVSDINPFHAAAVRQVIDYLAGQGCDDLGIITNTRLTAGSKEFARSRHCTLIGEEEFPDFVLGRSTL